MKTGSLIRANLLPNVGLIVPPLLWAANTQAGQILPYAECGTFKFTAVTSFAAAALSLVTALLSWWIVRRNATDALFGVTAFPASYSFVGLLSGLNGALFCFALILQGAASLVLTGCER